jgi:hypothetical protein
MRRAALYSPRRDTMFGGLLRFVFQGLAMTSSDAFALRRSGLNEFLFASVGTEPNGMALSVLSLFARLGDDPWKEAGKLVGMRKGEAIESLAQTIVRMPRSVWTLPDATTIAARLVALLPTRIGDAQPRPSINNRKRIVQLVLISLFLVVLGFAMASRLGLFATDQAGKLNGSDVSMMKLGVPPSPPRN